MYRVALIVVLFLVSVAALADRPPLKFRRGVELLESYRELLPAAFGNDGNKRSILETWNNVKGLLPQKGIPSEHTASAILANHLLADRICGHAAGAMISDFKKSTDYSRYFWGRDLAPEEDKAVADLERNLAEEGLSEERRFQTLCTLFCNADLFIVHD